MGLAVNISVKQVTTGIDQLRCVQGANYSDLNKCLYFTLSNDIDFLKHISDANVIIINTLVLTKYLEYVYTMLGKCLF